MSQLRMFNGEGVQHTPDPVADWLDQQESLAEMTGGFWLPDFTEPELPRIVLLF